MMENGSEKSCSLNNEYVQVLLSGKSNSLYGSFTLKQLIDGYYLIYSEAFSYYNQYKNKLMETYNSLFKAIYKTMRIENVKVDENGIYSFEFVGDVPNSYRLPFVYNSRTRESERLEYVGEEVDVFVSNTLSRSRDRLFLDKLESALIRFVKVNNRYSFKMKSLPYAILIDHDHILITKDMATNNNLVSLVDIDLKNCTIEFDDIIDDDEFTAMFRDYLILLLENAYIEYDDIIDSLKIDKTFRSTFVDRLLKINEEKAEKIPAELDNGTTLYFLIVPNEGYKLITDFKSANKLESNHYEFTFRDHSKMIIPASNIIEIGSYTNCGTKSYDPANTTNAFASFKKLALIGENR